MPATESHLPKLCRHKAKNRAFVRLNGETIYFGPWGSAEAREKYDRLVREWLANDRQLPAQIAPAVIDPTAYTIEELCADYLDFARSFYVKNGEMTDEAPRLQAAIRAWVGVEKFAEHHARVQGWYGEHR
jgi:hypothetical protein